MAIAEFVNRLVEAQKRGDLDWRQAREKIHEEHAKATTTEERVICLELHKAVMDAVARNNVTPEKMEEFQKIRWQDFRTLLIGEAIIGRDDGNIDPRILAAITSREVAAGRLPGNDELHTLALAGPVAVGPAPERKASVGILAKIRSWFK